MPGYGCVIAGPIVGGRDVLMFALLQREKRPSTLRYTVDLQKSPSVHQEELIMEEKQDLPEPQLEPIPAGQIWFDRIFVLMALSILISGLIYNAWGLLELFR